MQRKFIPLTTFLMLTVLSAISQTDSTRSANNNIGDSIFTKVDMEATFSGGDQAWRRYLELNLNGSVTADNGAPDGTYTVIIQFLVNTDGSIQDLKALTNQGYGTEEEVIRIFKIGPKWVPAQSGGRAVRAYRKQPVTFIVITDDGKKKKKKNKD